MVYTSLKSIFGVVDKLGYSSLDGEKIECQIFSALEAHLTFVTNLSKTLETSNGLIFNQNLLLATRIFLLKPLGNMFRFGKVAIKVNHS